MVNETQIDTTETGRTTNANTVIVWMLLAVFGVGTVEYLVAGVLPDISSGVGVSNSTAGLLITIYAATVVIGGPLLTIATTRIPRTPLIIALMALFIAGNIGTALAPNFSTLVIFRVLTALPHATFFALCLVLATSLVAPEFQGRVIARVTLGLNLATVLGVPLGTLIGTQLGWRWSFAIIALFQLLVTAGLLVSTRQAPQSRRGGKIASELNVFTRGPVLWAIALTALSQAALFVVFTYISPYLTDHAGISISTVTIALFLFGLGSVTGNQLGGHFADKALDRTLYVALTALTVALAVLFAFGSTPWFAFVWMFVLGAAGFSIIPPLASKLIGAAHEAPHLAATVNIAGFQLANAAGAWIGSIALSRGGNVSLLPAIGAILAAGAVLLLFLSRRPRRVGTSYIKD
ncbi:MFS transporter [Rhodococcus sp. H29-C3]|uniref:MFS transporter n=1 Tax=Rhodococcus sp. H29-C3 TaxID=3046307 RepID=UPI0024BA11BD|nr:MFS transporter [Rhodococcus sp. H29-C3]MDJ0363192.1 MFS transporter [Rhodococcus sp. H29-C3]